MVGCDKKASTHKRYEVSCRRLKRSFRGHLDEIDAAILSTARLEPSIMAASISSKVPSKRPASIGDN